MTDREKLIELLMDMPAGFRTYEEMEGYAENVADYLIANGVTLASTSKLLASSKWIPIEDEQKPKDRRNYFIAYVFGDSDMHFFGEAMYHAYEGNGLVDRPHFSNEGTNGMRVTHWMEIQQLPRPEPPKGE